MTILIRHDKAGSIAGKAERSDMGITDLPCSSGQFLRLLFPVCMQGPLRKGKNDRVSPDHDVGRRNDTHGTFISKEPFDLQGVMVADVSC